MSICPAGEVGARVPSDSSKRLPTPTHDTEVMMIVDLEKFSLDRQQIHSPGNRLDFLRLIVFEAQVGFCQDEQATQRRIAKG